jgi:hypothetical protein
MLSRIFFLASLLCALAPVRGWTAEVSSRLAELEKGIAALKSENKQLGRQLDEKQSARR